MDELLLGGLLAAKMCHDLVNPVGAARNGLDLAGEESDPALKAEALALTADSLADALSRLKYQRLAFGAESQGHTMPEARRAAAELFARGRVKIDWPEGSAAPEPAAIRIGLNLILVVADALPRGGVVAVDWQAAGMTLVARGDRAALKPDVEAALALDGDGAGAEAKLAPALLAAALARRLGAAITCAGEAGQVRIVCAMPRG